MGVTPYRRYLRSISFIDAGKMEARISVGFLSTWFRYDTDLIDYFAYGSGDEKFFWQSTFAVVGITAQSHTGCEFYLL